MQVEILVDTEIKSLADGFDDRKAEDISLRAKVAEDFGNVILIPTIILTPAGSVEFSEYGCGPTNDYD